jgi:type IV secretory pathway VirB2 component (pilin)
MLDRVAELVAAFDSTGTGPLSGRVALAVAALVVVTYAIVAVRSDHFGKPSPLSRIVLALVLMLAAAWVFNSFRQRDLAAEQRSLEDRAFELAARAVMPGSALACLDAVAGEAVEDTCEKALFATPEATAAAVTYVATELSLLAAASEHLRRGGPGYGSALTNMRRSLEADRFGIVAHVLAVRDGCTPGQCAAFAFLQGTGRVSVNLAERPFDAYLRSHMASWPAGGAQAASNPPAVNAAPNPPALASARQPNNLYFPSASSIPPVNIMTPEPLAGPNSTTGAAAPAPAAAPARKLTPPAPQALTPPAPQARQAPAAAAAAPAPAAPLQLAPGQ